MVTANLNLKSQEILKAYEGDNWNDRILSMQSKINTNPTITNPENNEKTQYNSTITIENIQKFIKEMIDKNNQKVEIMIANEIDKAKRGYD